MKSFLTLSLKLCFVFLLFPAWIAIAQHPLTPPAQNYVLSFYSNEVAVAPSVDKLNLKGSFTMETWLFMNDSITPGVILGRVLDPCGGDPGINYTIEANGNSTLLNFNQSTGQPGSRRSILSSRYLKLRTWNHVAATLGNNTMKLFINGEEVGSQISPGLPKIDTVHFAVGGIDCSNAWGNGFSGSLREVRIWSRALTSTELLLKAGIVLSGTEPDLIANWRLDEGYGQIAHDRSPNKYDLKLGFKESSAYWHYPQWTAVNILESDPYFKIKRSPTIGISRFALIDFDNNKNLDVIGSLGSNADWSPTSMVAFRNNGSGIFSDVTNEIFVPTTPRPVVATTLIVQDFNKDNLPDLYIGDCGADTCCPSPGGQSQLLLQSADKKMVNVTDTHMPHISGFSHFTSFGDIDNDGDIDINNGACDAPRIYVNDGTGHFTADINRLPREISLGRPSITAHAFLDVDGDGFNDIVLGPAQNQNLPRYLVLKNDGRGYFNYSDQPLAMPLRYGSQDWYNTSITPVDINGDGKTDFISTLSSGDFTLPGIQLVINNGDGTFRDATYQLPSQSWPPGSGTDFVTPCDVNGDGLLDLVVSTNLVSPQIYLNRGNAVFVNATEFLTRVILAPGCFIPGDMNNDGRIDFVTSQGQMVVLENIKNISINDLVIPSINKLSSFSGKDGDTIRISGTNFTGATEVHFGQKSAAFQLVSDSVIVAVAPHFTRNGKVTITTPKGAVVSDKPFAAPLATVNILLSNSKISDLAGLGSTVGLFSTEDQGEVYSHTYAFATGNGLNDADNAKFTISGDILKINTILSANLQTEYHINIKYSELGGLQATKEFTITTEGEGLVAYYPFNGNANDESGNNHNGSPSNVSLTTDQYGKVNSAYSFDGSNSRIQIGNHLGLIQSSPGFTITAWVYPEELQDGLQYTVLAERDGAQNYQFCMNLGWIKFAYWSGGQEWGIDGYDPLITPNKWYFIAVTYDGTNFTIYKDGLDLRTMVNTSPIDNNPSNLLIGQIYGNSGVFKGKIDELSIYDKYLSPERIKELYSCSSSRGGKVTGSGAICPKTTTGVLTLSENVGNVMMWQKKSGNGPWVSIPSTGQTYTEIAGPSGTYYYRTVTQYGTCDIQYSEPDTVIVRAIDMGISQQNNVLTANATPATYQWINCSTNSPIAGQISQSYAVPANGSYTVKITQNGCIDTSACVSLINPFPDSAGTISGTNTVCPGQNSVNYIIPIIDNATTYVWTLPAGATGTSTTNSIAVSYGTSAVSGNITVNGHNATGDGASSTLPITVNPLPAEAGTITGVTSVCLGQNSVTYTIPEIANATTYIWTLPTGAGETIGTSATNSISVDYGMSAVSGNISVKGHNDCGDGAASNLAITVRTLPAGAGTISGSTTVCQGHNSFTYTVPAMVSATSYIWTLPTGATETIGTNASNTISVDYSTSAFSGNISVKGHNDCGDGVSSTLAITVSNLPAGAGTISGSSTVCQGQISVTYSVPVIASATSYIWTLPTGTTETIGTSATNSISVNYGTAAISGNISVRGHNDCGDGAASNLAITVNPLPDGAGTIIGSATVYQGQNSVTYTVPAIPNATSYIWSLPPGATGTSTNNSILVNYGASAISGNIAVRGHNDCGDGGSAILAITVKFAGTAPQLSYRLANPRIVGTSLTVNNFQFDIQVQCDQAGFYLWAAQICLSFNNSTFNNNYTTWNVTTQGTFSGSNTSSPDLKYTTTCNITGSAPNLSYNIALIGDNKVATNGPNPNDFAEIPTRWTTLVTVKARMSDLTGDGLAGISFVPAEMDGFQQFIADAYLTYANFRPTNHYDSRDFLTAFTGRIYSTNYGWSQLWASGTGNAAVWSTALGTTVWDGSPTMPSGAANAKALQIQNPATLTIPVTGQITVTGTPGNTEIDTPAGLIIQSDRTGTGSLITNSVSGSGTAVGQCWLTTGRWHIVSSPVIQKVTEFLTANGNIATNGANRGMMDYNPVSNAWNSFFTNSTTGSIGAGKGFCMRSAGDGIISSTGALQAGTVALVDLSSDNWNCVGNPYCSAVGMNQSSTSLNNFLNVNGANLDPSYGAAYFWDNDDTQNGTGSYIAVSNVPSSPIPNVQQGQAFMVKMGSSASTLSFTEAMQLHAPSLLLKSTTKIWPTIKLKAIVNLLQSTTIIAFNSGMTRGLDPTFDAGLFKGGADLLIYTKLVEDTGTPFAIQALPDNIYDGMIIPVGIDYKTGGEVIFSAETFNLPSNCKVILEDKLTATFTDLSVNIYKAVIAPNSVITDRFRLHNSTRTSALRNQGLSGKLIAYPYLNSEIRIIGDVSSNAVATFYDMQGKPVIIQRLAGGSLNVVPISSFNTGLYLLTVRDGVYMQTFKILLKQ